MKHIQCDLDHKSVVSKSQSMVSMYISIPGGVRGLMFY